MKTSPLFSKVQDLQVQGGDVVQFFFLLVITLSLSLFLKKKERIIGKRDWLRSGWITL
jgi:hypothetical protein